MATITKKEKVKEPKPPTVEAGQLAMRMIYNDGIVRDIIAVGMVDAVAQATRQATKDGKRFNDPNHVISWERVA